MGNIESSDEEQEVLPESGQPTEGEKQEVRVLRSVKPTDENSKDRDQSVNLDFAPPKNPHPTRVVPGISGGRVNSKQRNASWERLPPNKDTKLKPCLQEVNFNFWGGGGGGDGKGGGAPNGGSGGNDDPYSKITLDDVGGLDTQKEWLLNFVMKPLKDPQVNQWGIQPPKGILFYGPPGTGKTLLARAFGNDLSKQLGIPVTFYHRKGGDFMHTYFGESERSVRTLFQQAKLRKPAIIFLDELDGVCPNRDGRFVAEVHASIVTTFLGEMDTLKAGEVFVFGATNRLDAIDPAMRRPGRFDQHLEFLPPDFEARKRIIVLNTRKWKNSHPKAEFLHHLGKATAGYTGADLDMVCRNVFYVAFNRHVPNADIDIGCHDLQITPQDWEIALNTIKPSNSAVFGSSLHTPNPPHPKISKLAVHSIDELSGQVDAYLKEIADRSGKWTKIGNQEANSTSNLIINTCLAIDLRSSNDESLENFVIPSVLTQPHIGKYPIYRLSKQDILNTSENHMNFIARVIHQAANSLQPCILYMPQITTIFTDFENLVPVITTNLDNLRGKQVLLLATSSDPIQTHPVGIKRIFSNHSRSWESVKPALQERKEFFQDLFKTMLDIINGERKLPISKKVQQQFDTLKADTLRVTHDKSLKIILSIHDELLLVCAHYSSNSDPTKIESASTIMKKVISKYR